MPNFLQTRSTRLEDQLADKLEEEALPPLEVIINQPLAITQDRDTVILEEEVETLSSAVPAGGYIVVPINCVVDPIFVNGLTEWTLDTASEHTLDTTHSNEKSLLQGQTPSSLKVELAGSTGSGESELTQDVDVDVSVDSMLSFEAWVHISSLTGNPSIELLVETFDSGGNLVGTSSAVEQDAVTTDWVLLKVEGFSLL